jgi:hypothetical protein
LNAQGVDLASAAVQGRYISLDPEEVLSQFMVNDLPDEARFFKIACDLIMSAAKAARGKHPRVSICAECAPALCAQGKEDAAILLEQFCNEIVKTYEVDILCGYDLECFERQSYASCHKKICAEHSIVRSR